MEPNYKKQMKIDKIIRKKEYHKHLQQHQQLNNQSQVALQFKAHQKGLNHDQYDLLYIDHQTQVKKSKQWWSNIDRLYFKQMNRKDILFTKNLTTTEKLSNYFDIQTQSYGSYFNEEIYPYFSNQDQNTLIKVLFKSVFSLEIVKFSCVNYTTLFNRRINKNKQHCQQIQKETDNWKIINLNYRMQTQMEEDYENNLQDLIKNINFQFVSNIKDPINLIKIVKFQQSKHLVSQNKDQIALQLKLWQAECEKINIKNSILWNTLLSNFVVQQSKTVEQKIYTQEDLSSIKQLLTHYTILRYFQHGTKDKSFQMLQALLENMKNIKPLKARESNNKKFFQTDCKICFCSFNSDSNQVLYCDMCNTSFHLACYGLTQIPQQKQYFCDCCTQIKKQQIQKNIQIKKIACQICCKANFPMKLINGHFYHITCLVIFNFITLKKGVIQLKDNISNETILKKVVQSEIDCLCCIFCTGTQGFQSGMQFKCSYYDCRVSMHPICAYINGCLFQIKKNMKQKMLDVKIFCNKHDVQRNYVQQSYLRRYMCNFKNTSLKTFQSFKTQYQAEYIIRQNKACIKSKSIFSLPPLLFQSKNAKKYCNIREQKQSSKKNEIEITETGKMLQKLVKQLN